MALGGAWEEILESWGGPPLAPGGPGGDFWLLERPREEVSGGLWLLEGAPLAPGGAQEEISGFWRGPKRYVNGT